MAADTLPSNAELGLAGLRVPLHPPLVGAAQRERLHLLTGLLPASSQVFLETPLATPGAGRVDLAVQLRHPDEAAVLLRGPAPLPAALRSLLATWSEPAGPLAWVSRLWLEFDLPPGGPAVPTPVVCARLEQPVPVPWLTETLFPALRGRPVSPATATHLERAVTSLPPGALVLYAFALEPRPGRPVRLEIANVGIAAAVDWVARIAPHRAEALTGLAPLVAGAERLHVSLDFTEDGVGPRLGIEGSFPRQPAREPRWQEWLERLVALRLADPARVAAVLAWPGIERSGARQTVRGLSHLKVAGRAGEPAEAKAYLTLVPRMAAPGASSAARASARST